MHVGIKRSHSPCQMWVKKAPTITSVIAPAASALILGKRSPKPPIISIAATPYRVTGAYPQCENLTAHWMADGPLTFDHPTSTNRHARKIVFTRSATDRKFFIPLTPLLHSRD